MSCSATLKRFHQPAVERLHFDLLDRERLKFVEHSANWRKQIETHCAARFPENLQQPGAVDVTKTNYLWDDLTDTVDRELDDNGDSVAIYTNRPDLYGKSFSQNREDKQRYYHYDGQGNTRALTDENENVSDTNGTSVSVTRRM